MSNETLDHVEVVFVKEGDSYTEYVTMEAYAVRHNMSRQSVYMRARYGAPKPLEHVRLRNIYLIRADQPEGDENGEVQIETSDSVPA